MSYARQKTSSRVYVMIAVPWIVSIAISSPIVLGLNYNERRAETPTMCTFYNPDFLIYSSMGSFYIPSIVMTVLYGRIYLVIRSRTGRSVKSRSTPSQCRPTSAWRPSTWSRAFESCTIATVTAPPRLAAVSTPLSDVTGRPPTVELAVAARQPATDAQLVTNAAALTVPSAADWNPVQLFPHPVQSTETNAEVDKSSRRGSDTPSSDESSSGDEVGVADMLMPMMPRPFSSTTVTMVVVSPDTPDDAATVRDSPHVGVEHDLCCLPSLLAANSATDGLTRTTSNGGTVTSSSMVLSVPMSTTGLNKTEAHHQSTATKMTSLTVPGSIDQHLSDLDSLGRCENSVCRVADDDDSVADENYDHVTNLRVAAQPIFRFNGQQSNINCRYRQQQQQQFVSMSINNQNKLKRAARRERKATKTLAIVLGETSIFG